MYANIAFAILFLGIFSIFELFKNNRKFSLLKYYMFSILLCLIITSFFDYLFLTGHDVPYYKEISRFFVIGLIINLVYILVFKKIPRIILILESVIIFFFIIEFINGFQFPSFVNNQLEIPQSLYNKIFYIFCFLFTITSLLFAIIKLFVRKNTNNLYESKIKIWVGALLIAILILILMHVIFFVVFLNEYNTLYSSTFITLFIIRFYLILFILFRPKFLDDDKISIPFNELLVKPEKLSIQKFEFIFYNNQYFLLPNANIEDIALKLNATKSEFLDFLKNELNGNFTEIVNKNRIMYLENLLKARKYESFTIEALSEMSGFNNRRSMYNAFKKYIGMTPTDYIQKYK